MCVTPELPVFDGSRVPDNKPVRCVGCGQEIYLACGKDSAPVVTKAQAARRNTVYAAKPCLRCTRMFDPKGPRSLYCDRADCSSKSSSAHPET